MVLTPVEIARKTIEAYLNHENFELDEETKNNCCDERACFVTLTLGNNLRGCIGCLDAEENPLWKNIQENAINAGFSDPRFPQLSKQEIDKIKIEVSVLTNPEKLEFSDENDLLSKIDKDMGIILKKGVKSATFLPQVWEQLPDKIKFLQHLCLKAGLDKNAWKSDNIEIFYYRVEKFEED